MDELSPAPLCIYCKHPIVRGEPGYGFYEEQDGAKLTVRHYHSECMNVTEGVAIA